MFPHQIIHILIFFLFEWDTAPMAGLRNNKNDMEEMEQQS